MSALVLAGLLMQPYPSYENALCDQEQADRGITMHMNICAKRAWEREDTKLNETWSIIAASKKRLDASAAKRDEEGGYFAVLLEAQRAWLIFRDAHCTMSADTYRGGTMQRLVKYTCLEQMTEQRVQQLRDNMVGY